MFNKDVLMKFISSQQQKTQPVVSNEGFLNGAPPAGTNYRIPSDTLYNPTPHRIKAVSDNGIEAVLEPNDETNVHFPGAQYVDEYEMKMGGLSRFLPKAQIGREMFDPEAALYPDLAKRAQQMGHNSIAEYRNSNWGYGKNYDLKTRAKLMGHDNVEDYERANFGYGIHNPGYAKERPLDYLTNKSDSVYVDRMNKLNANDNKSAQASEPGMYDFTMDPSASRINLTKGRFNTGKVSTALVDELVAAAKRQGVDPWTMIGLAGRESTLGVGYSNEDEGDLRHLVSGWNVAENHLPYGLTRFLADKQVPGIITSKDTRGWNFQIEDPGAVDTYLKANPQLVRQYVNKLKSTPDIGELNSLDLAAQKLKKSGIQGYNPLDPKYEQMFLDDINTLKQDPALIKYLESKGIREFGGLAKFVEGGDMIKRADGSYSQRGLWDNIRDNTGSGKNPTKEMLEQEQKIRRKNK